MRTYYACPEYIYIYIISYRLNKLILNYLLTLCVPRSLHCVFGQLFINCCDLCGCLMSTISVPIKTALNYFVGLLLCLYYLLPYCWRIKLPTTYDFQHGGRLPSWIFEIFSLCHVTSIGWLFCFSVQNFAEIGNRLLSYGRKTITTGRNWKKILGPNRGFWAMASAYNGVWRALLKLFRVHGPLYPIAPQCYCIAVCKNCWLRTRLVTPCASTSVICTTLTSLKSRDMKLISAADDDSMGLSSYNLIYQAPSNAIYSVK